MNSDLAPYKAWSIARVYVRAACFICFANRNKQYSDKYLIGNANCRVHSIVLAILSNNRHCSQTMLGAGLKDPCDGFLPFRKRSDLADVDTGATKRVCFFKWTNEWLIKTSRLFCTTHFTQYILTQCYKIYYPIPI